MAIIYDPAQQVFHLQSRNTSYVMHIANGYLTHLYWGKRIRHSENLPIMLQGVERASFSPNPIPSRKFVSLDTLPQEYPQYGTSDFRQPAYQVQLADGTRITELIYRGHRIVSGKPALEGLPAVYIEDEEEAQTLVIELADSYSGLTVELAYTAFRDHNAITRSAKLVNRGSEPLRLLRALSSSIDFADCDYEWLCLSGAWARERHIVRRPIAPGGTRIESRRGASGHQQNPFAALLRSGADEHQGDVFGFSFVYSGNFLIEAEVDQFYTTRVSVGINPFDFSWLLEPQTSFQTPEAVLVYSAEGLGGMSRTYHRLYRTRLCRGKHRDKERPVLVNNWEATYFDFDAAKIEAIAKAGAELGIELFVLDDGWFGRRNSDKSSLGDWMVNQSKLPAGLDDLAKRVNRLGLQFGLWVEPEMVSPDSDLYRAHPDWCLHVPGRRRTQARNQLVLDLSREDVREYLYQVLHDVFSSAPIAYVKWDMNRNMSEIGSATAPPERQAETAHRYMLGLYELMGRITAAFPDILFESCSGGGGRFDPGMLFYMPQTWTSDDTDAVERLKIQFGTSIVYPASSMGAHVSAVPNHQVHRTTSLQMRGDVAMSGNFGYELDLTKFSKKEREIVKKQVADYKQIRRLVQQGDLYRLKNPFEENAAAWMFVSEDQSEAVVFDFQILAEPNAPLRRLVMKGLNPTADYRIEGMEGHYGGDLLMSAGLSRPPLPGGDFASVCYMLRIH